MEPIQRIFPKLFSMFSDAEDLLNLEPEELAGPILLSLDGDDDITPKDVISFSRRLSRTEPMKNTVRYTTMSGFDFDWVLSNRSETQHNLRKAWLWFPFVGIRL